MSYDFIGKECNLSFHMIYYFVCLCLTNPKLCSLEQTVVLMQNHSTEETEFKVENLHDLKEF